MSIDWLHYHLRELATDRSRTLLVILGVVWGTLSLTVVLSFGEGFHLAMTRAMFAQGSNIIRLYSGATTRPHAGLPPGRWIGLRPEDGVLIQQHVPGVRTVCTEYITTANAVDRGDRRTNTRVHGVSPSYGRVRYFPPQPGGRFINEQDEKERRRVAFLGDEIKRALFGSKAAVGKTVRFWGLHFTVVGVLRPKLTLGNYEGHDRGKILIPAGTFRALRGWRYVSYLLVQTEKPDLDTAVLKGVYRVLGPRRGFHPEDEGAISVYNQIVDQRLTGSVIGGIRILMGIVGILGLLVALVGVANVMYVMVEERRREIGIQMAVGARPAHLTAGLFLEGLVLTLTGGAGGVAASAVLLRLFNMLPLGDQARGYLGAPVISLVTALVVIGFLAAAASVAAYVPARRAARLNPVEALHEE